MTTHVEICEDKKSNYTDLRFWLHLVKAFVAPSSLPGQLVVLGNRWDISHSIYRGIRNEVLVPKNASEEKT